MQHQKGFSLIETLVLAISAPLCCFSIGFFQDYFAKQQARLYLQHQTTDDTRHPIRIFMSSDHDYLPNRQT